MARRYLAEPAAKTHVDWIGGRVRLRDRVHISIRAYQNDLVRRGGR